MSAEVALLDYAFPFLLIGLFSKGCVRKGCEPKRDWGLRDGSGNWYFHSLLESHHGRIDDTRLRQHPDSSAAICQSFKRNELTPPPPCFCSLFCLLSIETCYLILASTGISFRRGTYQFNTTALSNMNRHRQTKLADHRICAS